MMFTSFSACYLLLLIVANRRIALITPLAATSSTTPVVPMIIITIMASSNSMYVQSSASILTMDTATSDNSAVIDATALRIVLILTAVLSAVRISFPYKRVIAIPIIIGIAISAAVNDVSHIGVNTTVMTANNTARFNNFFNISNSFLPYGRTIAL